MQAELHMLGCHSLVSVTPAVSYGPDMFPTWKQYHIFGQQGQSYETLPAAPRLAILEALLHIAADSETVRHHLQRTNPAEVSGTMSTSAGLAARSSPAEQRCLRSQASLWLCKTLSMAAVRCQTCVFLISTNMQGPSDL